MRSGPKQRYLRRKTLPALLGEDLDLDAEAEALEVLNEGGELHVLSERSRQPRSSVDFIIITTESQHKALSFAGISNVVHRRVICRPIKRFLKSLINRSVAKKPSQNHAMASLFRVCLSLKDLRPFNRHYELKFSC